MSIVRKASILVYPSLLVLAVSLWLGLPKSAQLCKKGRKEYLIRGLIDSSLTGFTSVSYSKDVEVKMSNRETKILVVLIIIFILFLIPFAGVMIRGCSGG